MLRSSVRSRFYAKVKKSSGCWLWTAACNADGYGSLRVDGKSLGAHRVSWALHRGAIPDGLCVLHECDTPACVRPKHLFLGTKLDNALDREAKGRNRFSRNRGEKNPSAKLTEVAARAIRESQANRKDLARLYGVSTALVSLIKTNRVWKTNGVTP